MLDGILPAGGDTLDSLHRDSGRRVSALKLVAIRQSDSISCRKHGDCTDGTTRLLWGGFR